MVETRSIARALRFVGYGVECTGLEEVLHVPNQEAAAGRTEDRESNAGPNGNGNGKAISKRPKSGNGVATQAQVRALFALSKKAGYGKEDLVSLLGPLNVTAFNELTRESASQLITYLQTEAGQ
ncbi:hypothetical protein ACFL2Q_11855 [Thermodesulfobacteriota bacterium]